MFLLLKQHAHGVRMLNKIIKQTSISCIKKSIIKQSYVFVRSADIVLFFIQAFGFERNDGNYGGIQ